jgi:hypothetical protein
MCMLSLQPWLRHPHRFAGPGSLRCDPGCELLCGGCVRFLCVNVCVRFGLQVCMSYVRVCWCARQAGAVVSCELRGWHGVPARQLRHWAADCQGYAAPRCSARCVPFAGSRRAELRSPPPPLLRVPRSRCRGRRQGTCLALVSLPCVVGVWAVCACVGGVADGCGWGRPPPVSTCLHCCHQITRVRQGTRSSCRTVSPWPQRTSLGRGCCPRTCPTRRQVGRWPLPRSLRSRARALAVVPGWRVVCPMR